MMCVQVAQTSALTDREQEEVRIMELENTVQMVQVSIYSFIGYVLTVPDVGIIIEIFLLFLLCSEVALISMVCKCV